MGKTEFLRLDRRNSLRKQEAHLARPDQHCRSLLNPLSVYFTNNDTVTGQDRIWCVRLNSAPPQESSTVVETGRFGTTHPQKFWHSRRLEKRRLWSARTLLARVMVGHLFVEISLTKIFPSAREYCTPVRASRRGVTSVLETAKSARGGSNTTNVGML